jgi:VWFA-related protein
VKFSKRKIGVTRGSVDSSTHRDGKFPRPRARFPCNASCKSRASAKNAPRTEREVGEFVPHGFHLFTTHEFCIIMKEVEAGMFRASFMRAGKSEKTVWRILLHGLMVILFAAGTARAQQQTPPAESTTTLKVSTEVVNVLAIVKKKGRLIADLNRDDFELTEDGTPQQIRYFSRETNTPLTLGILVDTSGSEQGMLEVEQQGAKAFVRQVIHPKDLAFVMHFDLEVELLQDLTSDPARLERAIDETRINTGGGGVMPGTFPGVSVGGTHLYDAVYLAAHDVLRNEIGRKVIILISDGEDQGSKESLDEALEMAQKSDIIIYSIEVANRRFGYGGMTVGPNGGSVLNQLSKQTGGTVIRATGRRDLEEAFAEIAKELRTQYLLGYTPTNTKHDGTFRRIEVKIRGHKYKVQARRGYYAPRS